MIDALALMAAWAAGGVLGAIFFGGLWWTVRKGVASTRPALWFAGSLLLRMSIASGGFYVVCSRHGERLLPCLVGFVMARLVVTRLTRPSGEIRRRPVRAPREAGHAP